MLFTDRVDCERSCGFCRHKRVCKNLHGVEKVISDHNHFKVNKGIQRPFYIALANICKDFSRKTGKIYGNETV